MNYKYFQIIKQKQSHTRKLVNNSLIFLLLFSIIFNISAARILVGHFDPDNADIYQDPEAGQEIKCDYWIKKSLDANGYEYDYHSSTSLSIDISSYDAVIATLGYHTC